MKNLILISILATSALAHAAPKTKDFIIAVKDDANYESCAKQVCTIAKKKGNGSCALLSAIGVITTNLNASGFKSVSKLQCILSIEESREVEAAPRVGRGN